MSRIAGCSEILLAILGNNFNKKIFKTNCLQKCITKIAKIARITNSAKKDSYKFKTAKKLFKNAANLAKIAKVIRILSAMF